jgi:hypothetical protein
MLDIRGYLGYNDLEIGVFGRRDYDPPYYRGIITQILLSNISLRSLQILSVIFICG